MQSKSTRNIIYGFAPSVVCLFSSECNVRFRNLTNVKSLFWISTPILPLAIFRPSIVNFSTGYPVDFGIREIIAWVFPPWKQRPQDSQCRQKHTLRCEMDTGRGFQTEWLLSHWTLLKGISSGFEPKCASTWAKSLWPDQMCLQFDAQMLFNIWQNIPSLAKERGVYSVLWYPWIFKAKIFKILQYTWRLAYWSKIIWFLMFFKELVSLLHTAILVK